MNDEEAQHVGELARQHGAKLAVRYGSFVIEELV
jgi:hypothetical protein